MSDTEISFIVGSSFAIFFAIAGIPLGRLADVASRKWVISISIIFWSVMTALCGLAKGFWTLFMCRVGIGIGEAGLNPSAMSMISDSFPSERRQLALTAYIISGMLGAGFAVVIGAGLLEVGKSLQTAGVLANSLQPWQWVFILIAIPGLPLALLFIFTVREPSRKNEGDTEEVGHISTKDAITYYKDRWQCFVALMVGPSLAMIVMIGFLVWGIPMVMRTYGLTESQAAFAFGLPLFASGVIGNTVASYFGHYLIRKGYSDGYIRAMLIMASVGALPVALGPLIEDLTLMMLVLAPFTGFLSGIVALPQISFQFIVPNRLRGQTVAIFYFIVNIVGYSIGPTSIALVTDYILQDEAQVKYSMSIVACLTLPMAIALFVWGLPYFRKEAEAMNLKR